MTRDGGEGSVTSPALSAEMIEQINIHGPYNHSIWSNGAVAVTAEEALTGRGAMLVREIRRAVATGYPDTPLAELSVLDVGCYDGWILHQLSAQPFGRLVGVEPRAKNIAKGEAVRQALGLDNRCEFRIGDIETLEQVLCGEQFDIVICTGLLHHLPSCHAAVSRLRSVCKGILFLETICLSASLSEPRFLRLLEAKDVMYFFGDRRVGVSAQKLETDYYDGSAVGYTVVSIPSLDSLRMSLSVQGFVDIAEATPPDAYRREIHSWRRFSAVCLTARVDPTYDPAVQVAAWVHAYERGLLTTNLPAPLIDHLHACVCRGGKPGASPSARLMLRYIRRADWWGRAALHIAARGYKSIYARELLKNLRFNAEDKVRLEYAKRLMASNRHEEAAAELLMILRRLNADWRAVYRACCLLSWCRRALGDEDGAERYAQMCRTANGNFPASLPAERDVKFVDAS